MSEDRKSIGAGLGALLALGAGYLLWRVAPFFIAFFFARSAVDFLNTPGEIREMRAGFVEVSDEWDDWLTAWEDSTEMTFRAWGSRVAASYTTEEELIEIYRWRAGLFHDVASDSTINGICGVNALHDESIDARHPSLDFGPISRFQGRGFARRHVGDPSWIPPVDLQADEQAWVDFVSYLDDRGLEHVADAFLDVADGLPVDNESVCRAQADLYRAAAQRPSDSVGLLRLIEFVRAMDVLGTEG